MTNYVVLISFLMKKSFRTEYMNVIYSQSFIKNNDYEQHRKTDIKRN